MGQFQCVGHLHILTWARERTELAEASGWGWSSLPAPQLPCSLHRKDAEASGVTNEDTDSGCRNAQCHAGTSQGLIVVGAEGGTFSETVSSPGTLKHHVVDFTASLKREALTEVQSHGFQSIPLHEHSVLPCVCLKVLVCLSCPLCLVRACLCYVSCRSEAGRASGWEPVCKGRGVATRWSLSSIKERKRDSREKRVDTFPRWCRGWHRLSLCQATRPSHTPMSHPHLTASLRSALSMKMTLVAIVNFVSHSPWAQTYMDIYYLAPLLKFTIFCAISLYGHEQCPTLSYLCNKYWLNSGVCTTYFL